MDATDGGAEGALALTAALMSASGRSGLDDAGYHPRTSRSLRVVIEGEIRAVDPRRRRIRVRSTRLGTRTIRMDRRTLVILADRELEAALIEPGDVVRVLAEVDKGGAIWADRVDVLGDAR